MRKFNLKDHVARKLSRAEELDKTIDARKKTQISDIIREVQQEAAAPETVKVTWRTDIGKIRRSNQDAVILGSGLAGIADGMGGHQGGEVASAGLRDGLIRELDGRQPDVLTLGEAIQTVNRELYSRQEEDPELHGMGTTLTVLWPASRDMLIAQVGDSRAYLFRDGKLQQMTRDHSMVADMVRRGILSEEQAARHPMRNIITRAVGTDEIVEPDIYTEQRREGDRWLVCSDGLHGCVDRESLEQMIQADSLEEAANRMMEAALEGGGKDNISLVLLQDLSGPQEEKAEPETDAEPAEEASL